MTDDYYTPPYYFVVLRKCGRNNQKQSWECVGVNNMYIRLTKSYRHLDYGEFDDFVTIKFLWPDVAKWRRYDTQKSVCSRNNLKNQCTTKFIRKTKLLMNLIIHILMLIVSLSARALNTRLSAGYTCKPKFRRYRGLKTSDYMHYWIIIFT